jgi:hypothetical protein
MSRPILIRHGEKTDDPQDPGLSALGLKRAHFLKTYLPQRFGHLDRLFAAENKPKSSRPVCIDNSYWTEQPPFNTHEMKP